jgi:hypothetical protein
MSDSTKALVVIGIGVAVLYLYKRNEDVHTLHDSQKIPQGSIVKPSHVKPFSRPSRPAINVNQHSIMMPQEHPWMKRNGLNNHQSQSGMKFNPIVLADQIRHSMALRSHHRIPIGF